MYGMQVFKTVIALIVLRFEKGKMYKNQINALVKIFQGSLKILQDLHEDLCEDLHQDL